MKEPSEIEKQDFSKFDIGKLLLEMVSSAANSN